MRRVGLVLVGAALAMAQPARASAQESWTQLGTAQGGNLYYDATRVTRTGSLVRVWLKRALDAPQDGIAYLLSQAEIDCDRQTARIVYTASYNSRGAVVSRDTSPVAAEPIAPGSFFDRVGQGVC